MQLIPILTLGIPFVFPCQILEFIGTPYLLQEILCIPLGKPGDLADFRLSLGFHLYSPCESRESNRFRSFLSKHFSPTSLFWEQEIGFQALHPPFFQARHPPSLQRKCDFEIRTALHSNRALWSGLMVCFILHIFALFHLMYRSYIVL